ncbi:hypothetical protein GJ744_010734 [Endocarpon pusillum]|uniref:THUMP domain-containing protein n=1 Tax=Endocarpon pusillum TaxID=364733 RepID=A0A8H7ADV5_9EURO|nr:hypothetical protein GJ744_010734 [Endocarpon pusillum]
MVDKPKPRQQTQSPRWKAQKASSGKRLMTSASGIHNDDAGIFVTCDKGQEVKCLREMDDILSEYIHSHLEAPPNEAAAETTKGDGDIEEDIEKELESLKSSSTNQKKPYTFVRLEIACVSFIRTQPPLDPVNLVLQICEKAYSGSSRQRSRYVKRLTPVSCIRKTLGNGLEQLCEEVLRPVFGDSTITKKFAIRSNIRNNEQLSRDVVIKTVADAVTRLGSSHSVDLTNYDCLILIEVYRNVCGMSVVGSDFEKLKRFNLSEIYQASAHEGRSTQE